MPLERAERGLDGTPGEAEWGAGDNGESMGTYVVRVKSTRLVHSQTPQCLVQNWSQPVRRMVLIQTAREESRVSGQKLITIMIMLNISRDSNPCTLWLPL